MSLLNQNKDTGSRALRKTKSVKDVIDFTKVGGLDHHLKTLREVIIFPLLHGNVFSHFKIKAPRGVLFYGPPGTGKTLVAGALATEINKEGIGKVSFFQRKGADILDKWVGESEKNLRLLFEKATKSRPSIIFFDELDGLAPVRSDKNDHIHSSVVATLLALMDGLDNKPGVIVIGATNRIDAIDPALRRPGRFDKELYFPLPGVEARKEIIQVHTNTWKQKPTINFASHLADITAGFCGSDLQALCSEAVLCCLRKAYPKIDAKGFKLKINAESLMVEERDFLEARLNLVPSTFKRGQKMRNLSHIIKPLLNRQQSRILRDIHLLWPHFLQEGYKYTLGEKRYAGRIILIGSNMQGLNTHLVPSILKYLEHLPAFIYDTRLFERTKSLTSFVNVQSNFPAVILLSRIDEWWNYIDDCDQHSIVSTLEEIHAGLPILTIASCKVDIPTRLHDFFYNNNTILVRIDDPNERERETFLAPLFFDEAVTSLYKVSVSGRSHEPLKRDIIKCESDNKNYFTRTCRKRKVEDDTNCDFVIGRISSSIHDAMICKSKKKRESSTNALAKRIQLCESKFGVYRSSSAASFYDLHKQMKTKNTENENGPRQYASLTSFQSVRNKQYFTRVLSDLLNQRNTFCGEFASNTTVADSITCGKLIKMEPKDEPFTAPSMSSYRRNTNESRMKKIYELWKHASLITSKQMAMAQLELLYDVISSCISIHQESFEQLAENLENLLWSIENTYIQKPNSDVLT